MIDSRQHAFSLMEMLVVIAVLSLVAVSSFRFIADAAQWYDRTRRQNRADESALAAVQRIEREIRALATTRTASNSSFSFVAQSGATDVFQCASGRLTLNGNLLADGVSVFSNAYYDATNGLTTNLSLIRRIALDFSVTDGTARADFDINFFYPREGTMK